MKNTTVTFVLALPLLAGPCDEIAAKFDPFNEKYQPTAARRLDGQEATIREAILELGTPVRILPHEYGRVLEYDSPRCVGRVFIASDERVWAVAMSPASQN